MLKKKIHYHTDCPFFAGCENMLVNFFSSSELKQQFDLSLSYRASKKYTAGLNHRLQLDCPIYPMRFPDFSDKNLLSKKIPPLIGRGLLFFLRLFLTIPLLITQIVMFYWFFRHRKPDLVHINNGGYPAALSARAAVFAAKLAGIKSIVMVVNNMAFGYARFSRWWEYPLDQLVAKWVTQFVTGSMAAGLQLKKVLRLPNEKFRPIHNGIALRAVSETMVETRRRLGLADFDGVLLGIVAVMELRKGHQILLKAVATYLQNFANKGVKFKVLIEGDGPLRDYLEAFVLSNQLSDHCIFVGTEKNVMNFMAVLDVLILPSIMNEDFPNVILEAMAMEKAIIASNIAGIPEQIEAGKTGILVDPNSVEQLASAVDKLIINTSLRTTMGRLGRQRFLEFFVSDIAVRNYKSLYQLIIRSNG
jgi:glycosyltransferase involved in cell wall biosynthesis